MLFYEKNEKAITKIKDTMQRIKVSKEEIHREEKKAE